MTESNIGGIQELNADEAELVNGGGLINWLRNERIVIFGIEVSDGDPNT